MTPWNKGRSPGACVSDIILSELRWFIERTVAATNTGKPAHVTRVDCQARTEDAAHGNLNAHDEQVQVVAAALLQLVVFSIEDDRRDVLRHVCACIVM